MRWPLSGDDNMMRTKAPKNHSHGRPPPGVTDVLALTYEGCWIEDDGERHIAFSFRDGGFPIALSQDCRCDDFSCPVMDQALRKTSDRWSCANGRTFRRKP